MILVRMKSEFGDRSWIGPFLSFPSMVLWYKVDSGDFRYRVVPVS
jgi:hypothetical protein